MGVSYDEYKIDLVTVWRKCRRAWIPGQRLDPTENPRYEARIQALELFPGGPGKTDNVFTHSVLACGYAAVAAAH